MCQKKPPTCHLQIQAMAKALRLSQNDLIQSAGISRAAGGNYYHGRGEPRFSALQAWGVAYRLDMNWMFFDRGDMQRPEPQPPEVETGLLVRQTGHLRLLHPPRDAQEPREVVMSCAEAEAFEAQSRLIDNVCASLARNGASQETIQRAILAIVGGAF